MVTKDQIVTWLELAEREIGDNRVILTDLDNAVGDGDHGNNLYRGFRKLVDELPQHQSKDIGGILKGAAMVLRSSVGGASGSLYGAFFLKSADAVSGKMELSTTELGMMLKAGLDGVMIKGRAKPGDNTMVDTLLPAVEGYERAEHAGADTPSALDEAVGRAELGMRATAGDKEGLTAFGRRRPAEDPGAMSSFLVLRALRDAVA